MKTLTTAMILVPAVASAHPGHLADALGHDHWVAGAALGAAAAIALWGALKGKKQDTENETAEETEPQEA